MTDREQTVKDAQIARDADWQPMDTIPEDGTAVLCKLKSGHVIVTWSAGEWSPGVRAWLSEMTDLWVSAVLDDDDMPDTSDESRVGWMPYSGRHPADPPEDPNGQIYGSFSEADGDIPF